ncbi:hypothetical protein DFJ74DRAFT_401579 [Hyaloraphidium curvatum]|nr:hypothetical protein DFJ74DRAFT_401579 [Hyaloraphidium curvatum]
MADIDAALGPPPPARLGPRALGLLLVGAVVLIWTASSFLTQDIYADIDAPFFVTFVNTASFAVYLLPAGARAAALAFGFGAAVARSDRAGVRWADWWATWVGRARKAEAADGGVAPPSDIEEDVPDSVSEPVPARNTAALSLAFCLLWFAANYCSNLALSLTSVSSATILASTSGLWTLALSYLAEGTPVDPVQLASVLLSLLGVVAVSLDDGAAARPRTLPGDAAALLSAALYAGYSVLLHRLPPRTSPVLFLGFVGLWNVALLWPAFIPLHLFGLEPFPSSLPARTAGALALNACVGTALSDLLWLLAVVLVTPLVVTVGLSLTIPLAVLGDFLLKGSVPTPFHVAGGALVVLGFVGVNVGKGLTRALCGAPPAAEGFVAVPGGEGGISIREV